MTANPASKVYAFTFFVALWLLLMVVIVWSAPLIACSESHPGDVRPRDWAWRTIDGRACWYQGRQMMPKDRLFWPQPEPQWIKPGREDPEIELPQEPWALEHRWPVLGRGE